MKQEDEDKARSGTTTIRMKDGDVEKRKQEIPESVGFEETDEGIGIIKGNVCLENRSEIEPCHYKSCFFSAILIILIKITLDAKDFRGSILDQLIFLADKIFRHTGKLRYKLRRCFYHVNVLDMIYDVILKQTVYADPEACQADELENAMRTFMEKHQTGILVFANCSFAFWTVDGKYYLFDPYACDENGFPNEEGYACLMAFCDLDAMIDAIKRNAASSVDKPYRIYTVSISHMERKKRRKRRRRRTKVRCVEKEEEEPKVEEPSRVEVPPQPESSLMELSDWVTSDSRTSIVHDSTIPGFAPIKNHDASMLDVVVLENDVTSPILAPFRNARRTDDRQVVPPRRKIYDRKFREHPSVATPLDLCVIAWSLIHDPITWSVRTVRGLFEASTDYTFDSILASEDSTVVEMMDGLLPEFEIANYSFRPVFVLLQYGTLYATQGWNLSMSLRRVFETPVYTGAIIVCGDAHVGVTKKEDNFFAWWTARGTKNIRIFTTTNFEEFLRLIVREIEQTEQVSFVMRAIVISYAQKMDPDCSDVRGLHESVVPATSLAEVHRRETGPYDVEAIFTPTIPEARPVFVRGTVALGNRERLKEPKVKRCYFVAVLAVMVKRDIVQSPMPGMIDKIIEVAEALYREFSEPKFHTEHILRNVTVMDRLFDLRDCSSPLVVLTINPRTGRNDFYVQVRKHLKNYFKTQACGILHFTNCCYGFWYSRATNSYYYLDPYQCNEKGRKTFLNGKACLCIFPTACQMVKHMCFNQFQDTTGFFIHRLHVDSINVPPFKEFKEDPMWLYLDYHWNFSHAPEISKTRSKVKKESEDLHNSKAFQKEVQQFWNNYTIEVSDLIYSIWGTIGCYDPRFGDRAGKNQAAICVAVLAMQYLSHPSRWGPAILDSAVICGDSYYTESLKSSARRCAKHFNRFNLQSCFKVFPHQWTIDFGQGICGILYGGRNRLNLANALKQAFEEAPNVLIECNGVTLAALAAKDGYYVADPCWIGPPLFIKDHGAIYVLRCRNMNSLIYVITKMLNTNQRLDFRLTTLAFTFEQEDFKFTDTKMRGGRKKVLVESIRTSPGKVEDTEAMLTRALTVPDEDSYLQYRRNLTLGKLKGAMLENPQPPCLAPTLKQENMASMMVSTRWHLNLGQADPLKRPVPAFDPLILQHVPEECEQSMIDRFEAYHPPRMSVTEFLAACNDYPRIIDFASEEQGGTRPLVCAAPPDFLRDDAQREFDKWTEDMFDEKYKTYLHGLPKEMLSNDEITPVGVAESEGKGLAVMEKEKRFDEGVDVDSADTEGQLESPR